ncbi:MAG: glycosidase [Ignavibacteriales bacterium]|nr:MAG: glycosidase [Ignavibacteriales bacterium]
MKNPLIYEINIRLLLRGGNHEWLLDIPASYWEAIRNKGFRYIWLMGVWETCESVVPKHCFQEGLIRSYTKALKDWTKEDVIGSPYAINAYRPSKIIGTMQDLKAFRDLLRSLGMGLILDFVPNHFSADSELIAKHPEYFLEVSEDIYNGEPHTFYRPENGGGKYFAHGRDPFFPAWTDTIQVNFTNPGLREYYRETLTELTEICDGVRCDMAMLALNNVFNNTWGMLLENNDAMPAELWTELISAVKNKRNDFLFIAEAYWDLEWELQQMGFDYTYDKKLLDRLKDSTADKVRDHLKAEEAYQMKSLRFIENHDEERAVTALGKDKSLAAAVIIATIRGMRFFHHGQFQGKKIKLPVQLGREPKEQVNEQVEAFYEQLLGIVHNELFRAGEWQMLECKRVWDNNYSNSNMMAWQWSLDSERALVVVNYSGSTSQCRLPLDVSSYDEQFDLTDVLNNKTYRRYREELLLPGLFVELGPWQSHIFRY